MSSSLVRLLRELSGREIDYVVVGGMAAVLQGAPVVTADVDIVHRRSEKNVAKLLELLRELKATFRYDNRGLVPNETHLMGSGHVLLKTSLGPLDVLCEVNEESYEELVDVATEMSLGEGLSVQVVRLEKLIEQKTAANRPKDQMALPTLRATLEELERRK